MSKQDIITEAAGYRPVKLNSVQAGCGHSFNEVRWFVERVEDGKLVRDIGPANVKWSAEVEAKAIAAANSLNARAA